MKFTLEYVWMDMHGDIDEKNQEVSIQAGTVKEAVNAAQKILQDHGGLCIPFMPQLLDSEKKVVAATIAWPPYAHRLTWIRGSAIGSPEDWVCA